MDIQAEKIELVKMLLEESDPAILNEVRAILQHEEEDFWDELPQHVKDGINEGIQDAENGRVYPHEEVMKEFKSKYGSQR